MNERNTPGLREQIEGVEDLAGRLDYSNSNVYPELDPIYEARLAGWLEGHHGRDAEVSRLKWEADLWYFCANNRGKRPSDYYAAATDRLWAEASK